VRYRQPDNVCRLINRRVPQGIGPEVDGRDCYVFRIAGGLKPSDVYTDHIVPVEAFWGSAAVVGR
jgi:hypothetical protein